MSKEPNNQYGVDAQAELEKLLWECQQNESKEDFYDEKEKKF